MNRKVLLSLAGAAVGAFLMFGTAQAAPATGALDGLKTLGVKNEFVVYANEGHRISKPENRRDIVRRAIAWFDGHLK